jgi:hypothetical protein
MPDNFTLKFIGSIFHTLEQEYFDILLNTVWAK